MSAYTNNSIVTRTDIGTGSAALLCTTTLPGCCTRFTTPQPHWYFPNGSEVVNDGGLPYYRTRSSNPGTVLLHRNPQGTTTGIFLCDIPDASGVLQSLYVGIYDSGTGESCTLSEYSYLVHTQYSRNVWFVYAECHTCTLEYVVSAHIVWGHQNAAEQGVGARYVLGF